MSSVFNKYELLCIALLLDEEEEQEARRSRRRYWVHPSLQARNTEGEIHTLYKELLRDEEKFKQYFKMSILQFTTLLGLLEARLTKKNTTFREAVTPLERLAVCLRFLATGDSFRTLAFSYRLGESTVRAIVNEVCQSIVEIMKSKCIPTPTREQWERIAEEFEKNWNFPNCLGAIDGKHVVIKAPPNSGSLYYNYKKNFSIVLMALVDADYNFISVDVGDYGKNSDGGIYANSELGKAMAALKLRVPEERNLPGTNIKMPFVMVADEAFPLKDYILRPYPGASMSDKTKRIFNYRLSRARRVVENAFGILSQKFKIYDRRLNLNPDLAALVVLTTCVLHNFVRRSSFGPQPGESRAGQSDHSGPMSLLPLQRQGGNATNSAFAVRETFAKYFVSAPGSVEWQNHV